MRVVLQPSLVYRSGVMDVMGPVWTSLGCVLCSLLLTSAVGCGDDGPEDSGTAGSSSNGGSSAGSSATAGSAGSATAGSGMGGATGGGDLSTLCMTVCSNYYAACPVDGLGDCPEHCGMLASSTPAGCSSLQADYLSCLSTRTPMCGSGSWAQGYEEECDSKGRGLCLKTKGAECIVGEAYDDVLCQSGNEGQYGYYCQQNVTPKPGCIVSTKTTRKGLHCCEQQLDL